LEPRHPGRRAHRRRHRRPQDARPRRDVPGCVPGVARTAAAPPQRAGRGGHGRRHRARPGAVRPGGRADHRGDGRRRPGRPGRQGRARMTWTALIALSAISYGLKASGPVLAGGRQLGPQVRRTLDLVAVPLLAALILVQTLGDGHHLVLDARVPALAVAAVLVWRRAPFLVVVLAAAATAALLRALA